MRWMTASASSSLPWMTSQRGDSGSRHSATAQGTHTCCSYTGGNMDTQIWRQVPADPMLPLFRSTSLSLQSSASIHVHCPRTRSFLLQSREL